MEVIVTLGGNPAWAASFPRGPINCLGDQWDERWTEYVSALVSRYSAGPYNVKYWAIYNEPDAASAGNQTNCAGRPGVEVFGDHPQEYVNTLQLAYQIIKAPDPSAVVLLGGIAYDCFTTDVSCHLFVRDFLPDILDLGAASYFDAMNFHYYPNWDLRWESESGGLPGIRGKTQVIQAVLAAHGVTKPIVCTELGSSSNPQAGESEDSQSRNVAKFYARALAAGNKIGIWYNMIDYSINDPFQFHGLLRVDATAKPSLFAYRTLAANLSGHTFERAMANNELAGSNNLEG